MREKGCYHTKKAGIHCSQAIKQTNYKSQWCDWEKNEVGHRNWVQISAPPLSSSHCFGQVLCNIQMIKFTLLSAQECCEPCESKVSIKTVK